MNFEHCLFIFLLTSATIVASWAHPRRLRFCGSHLSQALQLACEHEGYNVPSWDVDPAAEGLSSTTFRPRTTTVATEFAVVGVATECCRYGCTWSTLVSYCKEAPPENKRRKIEEFLFSRYKNTDFLTGTVQEMSAAPKLMAVAPEMNIENVERSAPLFGTVSPEYLRFPRTLDEVLPYYRMQHGF